MKSPILLLVLLAGSSEGFIQDFLSPLLPSLLPHPNLASLVDRQAEQMLSVSLDVGNVGNGGQSRLAVKDMILGLHSDAPDYDVAMPGMTGQYPKLSSGGRKITTIQPGQFISMVGREVIDTLQGAWEMVWKKDAPAGTVVFGWDLPKDYVRNEARLPKGLVYVSFPIWSSEGLSEARKRKASVMEACEKKLRERDEALEKYEKETNILKKMMAFREAAAALEEYWSYPVDYMKHVPEAHEIINMRDGLVLSANGFVWKTLPGGQSSLLGTATAAPVATDLAP